MASQQRRQEGAAAGLNALGGEGRPEAREASQDNNNSDHAEVDEGNNDNASAFLGSDASCEDLGKTVFDTLTNPVYDAETAPCMAEVLGVMFAWMGRHARLNPQSFPISILRYYTPCVQ